MFTGGSLQLKGEVKKYCRLTKEEEIEKVKQR
jgi:hypothetical protein